MKTQSVSQTIAGACKIRPVLKPFLESFEPLLTQRKLSAEKLAPLLEEAGFKADWSLKGQPLLQKDLPSGLGKFVQMAALDMLPLLQTMEACKPCASALASLFLADENEFDRESLIGAMLASTPEKLNGIANKYDMAPEILAFASEFIVSAVLRALTALNGSDFSAWNKSVCPVCGFPPIIAWLGKRPQPEANEFLTDGGGKKYLYCGMCGTDWHFIRGICPSCGTQGQDAMQIYGEEDRRHERIDWCKKCHAYLPQIDLRELIDKPDMDAMALCLMHLDVVASEKELVPLKPSFWNMF